MIELPSRYGPINQAEKQHLGCLAVYHARTHTRSEQVKRPHKTSTVIQLPLLLDTGKLRALSRFMKDDATYLERREMELRREKRCRICNVVKPYSDFTKWPDKRLAKTVGGVMNECKDCMLIKYRDTYMRRKYGITLQQYSELYSAQNGLCAICGTAGNNAATTKTDHVGRGAASGVLSVDHDHVTGKVRALLCQQCNHGLGNLQDSPELLRKAARYIEQYHNIP